MKFAEYPVAEAQGTLLAHSIRLANGERLRKGIAITAGHIEKLHESGIRQITVAVPGDGDVLEDDAAQAIGGWLSNPTVRVDAAATGRVNFFAKKDGLFCVDKQVIDAINAIDPGIGIATLKHFAEINKGRMVATAKIIPYAVPGTMLNQIRELAADDAITVLPFKPFKVGLIQSTLPDTKATVLDKTARLLCRRLELSGSVVHQELRIEHSVSGFAEGLKALSADCDLIICFGASAISDENDLFPAALAACGGHVFRFGMPVDPGNLLLLGRLGDVAVIGAPGCARSPAENGFDWVLQQILAGISPERIGISEMGVGGLLMETGARPHPRLGRQTEPGNVVALVLAAGQSRRMGEKNKMTVDVSGKPMVRHVVEAANASLAGDVYVVTGYQADQVAAALEGLNANLVHNADFASGLSTSLATGVAAVEEEADHILVLLGDMPFVTRDMMDELLVAGQRLDRIVMATFKGKRGNPVMWPRRYFEALKKIQGDTGARHLIGMNADDVEEIEIGKAALLDLDTPEAVKAANPGD